MGWLMILVPVGLLLLGFPVFLVLLTTVVVLIVGFLQLPFTVLPQIMFGSIDSFSLLAVPFFIFAGELMGRGGISRRIVDWVLTIFGRVRGSLGLTTVGTCEFFGAISGSSPATVAAVGRLLYPSLRKSGYDEKFCLGLVTSSGAIASVIPPSIIMILYGASAEQSVALLFVGGFLPGILIGLMMSLYIIYYARHHDLREGQTSSWKAFWTATVHGIWALGTPVVILGGIYTGVFTPTEAAGVAGIYGIIVTRFIYKDISWKGLWSVAVNSVFLTAQIMIIVAASGVFSWILTISGIPQAIVGFIERMQVAPWLIIIALNVFLLIVGCLIDPTSAILILTPLLVPIARNVGLDLIHFGIILTVNLSMGMFTPPFGLNIFVSQALFDAPLSRIFVGVIPFFLIQLIALGIITFVPELSLYLTRFVH